MTLQLSQEINQALGWGQLLQLVQNEARSFPAKTYLSTLEQPEAWATHIQIAQQLQREVQEMTPLLDRDALWGPLVELEDPTPILERLFQGSVLEIDELVVLRKWLYAIDSWVQIPRDEIRGEKFRKALTSLTDPFDVLRILERILTPQGELSEKASPKLYSLYSEIRAIKREIGSTLDFLLKSLTQKGVLQESFSDIRDGRYVVPVKISCQNEIEGIVHEASASRQTVFIEPKEIASLNNRLRLRQNELVQEIYVVLEETSKRLQPFVSEITASVKTLTYWDATQAKGRLARHYSGKPIQVTEDRRFHLDQTAHPLLWWSLSPDQIIRNQVEFGQPSKTLLLTGPNTGGKTVLLKTLGLAGICARTGFPFPATDHPVVPFFDSFFVDLGDSQSIERHLSSFSGHILKFKLILENITDQGLVLIDELNSATDPEEGAALGRAILETIMSRGGMIVTTTHDPLLKALATSDPRMISASMAFDEETCTPTYRLVVGVPGRSRALETAERLGIPKELIQLAKSYLSKQHNEFERILSKLEGDTQEAARARREAVAHREEAERLKKEWLNRTEKSVQELLEKTRARLKRVLEQAQDGVRATVRKLDEMKSRKEIDQARSTLNALISDAKQQIESALEQEAPELAKALPQAPQQTGTPPPETESLLTQGSVVRIPKWKTTGIILEIMGNKVKVSMGTLQMTLSTQEIEPMKQPANRHSGGQARVSTSHIESSPPQIDLRGLRLDEAMTSLEHYLDQAFRAGCLTQVTVIHGLGTGALREGTHHLLKKLPYVKRYRDGGPNQGGAGATLVEFDQD